MSISSFLNLLKMPIRFVLPARTRIVGQRPGFSTLVRLVLFDLTQNPVELPARDVGRAVAAVARHGHAERCGAAWAVGGGPRLAAHADRADQRPVLAVVAWPLVRAADQLVRTHIDRVIEPARPHPKGDRIEVAIRPDLDALHARDVRGLE